MRSFSRGAPAPNLPHDLPPDHSDGNGHQRADEVEQAPGGIGPGGHGQDGGLGHSATGPGIERGGDGGGVLDGAAEQAVFIPFLLEGFPEDVGCQQDGQVLVRDDAIEGGAGDGRGGDEAGPGAGEGFEEAGEVGDHPAGLHAGAVAHGAEDEEDSVEHAQHAAGGNETVHFGMAGFQRNGVVDAFHRAGEEDACAGALGNLTADAADDIGLEDEGGDGGGEDGDGEDGQCRHPFQDQDDRQDGDQHEPGRDVKFIG